MYSILEQHTNGEWWYHPGASADTMEEAEKWATDRYWMMETRPVCLVEHRFPFPDLTLHSYSLDGFAEVGTNIPYTWMDCKMIKRLN